MTWSVFSPTDTWTTPTDDLAEWSWVEKHWTKEPREALLKALQRTSVYLGPGWYCRRLVEDMLSNKCIKRKDIHLSFQPTTILPEDFFATPPP